LVTVGRITESKNLIELINILKAVRNDHKVSLTVVGGVVTEEEVTYQTKLTQHVKELGLEEEVVFLGMQSREKVSDILNRSKVFVTVAQNGSLDKAILEALATGLPVVSMAPGTKSLMLGDSQVEDSEAFITQLNTVIESSVYMREANVAFVRKNHSIESLIPKILNSY